MSNYTYYSTELYHHGVKGMKWGIRRYQNKDGSRTPAGLRKYSKYGSSVKSAWSDKRKRDSKINEKYNKSFSNWQSNLMRDVGKSNSKFRSDVGKANKTLKREVSNDFKRAKKAGSKQIKAYKKTIKSIKNSSQYKKYAPAAKKAAIGAAVVGGIALAAYGAYKISEHNYNANTRKYVESVMNNTHTPAMDINEFSKAAKKTAYARIHGY